MVVICTVTCLCVVSNWRMFCSRQWTSFLAGASTAGYVYIYSFYYYFFKTKSASSDILFFDFVIWCMLYNHKSVHPSVTVRALQKQLNISSTFLSVILLVVPLFELYRINHQGEF